MSSIAQKHLASQVTLKSGKTLDVPEGADPAVFLRFEQAKEDRAKNPRKKTRRTRSRRTRKTFRASQVLTGALSQRDNRTKATAELVERANESDSDSILVSCGKNFQVMEVAR